MDLTVALDELSYARGYFPHEAVQYALDHRADITPHLLATLETVCHDPLAAADDPDRIDASFAMYLLAKFREPRAYPLLIQFARLPGELPFEIVDYTITDHFSQILASVCGGDTAPIQRVVEDPSVNDYVRMAALHALNVLVHTGALTREQVVAYHTELLHGRLPRSGAKVWGELASCACELHPGENLDALRQAYDAGLVETTYIDRDCIAEAADKSVPATMRELGRHTGGYIDDITTLMKHWACFQPEWNEEEGFDFVDDHDPIEPFVRDTPKTGRNEPCPCGSGRKFKKCCGA